MSSKRSPGAEGLLARLAPERQRMLETVRSVVLEHLPAGYVERLNGQFLQYEVPLERYPKTYNGQPLVYAALASQKNYCALYLIGAYQDAAVARRLRSGFEAAGKKLDMGKSCLRFRRLDDLALDVVGQVIAEFPVDAFIAGHEAARQTPRRRKLKS
jgi:hypothetical protein